MAVAALMHCQLQVTGPDSKGLKSKYNAFHSPRNGRTTLACSGILVMPTEAPAPHTPAAPSPCTGVVLAPVSCLYPFIQSTSRHRLASASDRDLIPSVDISILINLPDFGQQLIRIPAHFKLICQLPAVQAAAAELLLSVNEASAGAWKLGWCLADEQPLAAATSDLLSHVAVLEVDLNPVLQHQRTAAAAQGRGNSSSSTAGAAGAASSTGSILTNSSSGSSADSSAVRPSAGVSQGQSVTVTGSPFGCLAEQQFFGAVVTGCVSLLLPAATVAPAAAVGAPLFLVDSRCMPGMEGGPIHCRSCGALLGVLGVPLSNCSSQAELLLGIPTAHLAAALSTAAAAAAAPASFMSQLGDVAKVLQAHSCCSCMLGGSCSGSSSGGRGRGCIIGDSSRLGGSAVVDRSSSSSSSSGGLQRHAVVAHDTSFQQPRKLLLERHPQQQQQQHTRHGHRGGQPQQQQQQQQQQQCNTDCSSNTAVGDTAAPVRRLQVHLKHIVPCAAAAGSQGSTDAVGGGSGSCGGSSSQAQHKAVGRAAADAVVSAAAAAVPRLAAAAHSKNQMASDPSSSSTRSSPSSSCSSSSYQGLPPSAAAGVVMVRAGRSWGSGVLITRTGLVLTVAHLFRKSSASRTAAAAAAAAATTDGSWPAAAAQQQGPCSAFTAVQHASSYSSSGSGKHSSSSMLSAQQQAASNSRRHSQPRLYPLPPQHLKDPIDSTVSVRLTLAPATASDSSSSSSSSSSSTSSSSSSTMWVPAQVLYCFSNYLDLAVLQILPRALAGVNPSQLQPLQLVPLGSDVTPDDVAYVIGHGLFGPQMGLAPAVTVGCVGRVAALPISSSSINRSQGCFQQQQQQQQGWRASMVISTAAVHSGASGGALVDAAGRLVGLVTSNARHVKGRTLPHLNFCISAAELRPVWDWAQQQQRQQQQQEGGQVLLPGAEGVIVQDTAQQLKRFDVESVAGSKLWALQPYLPTSAVQPASSL